MCVFETLQLAAGSSFKSGCNRNAKADGKTNRKADSHARTYEKLP